MPTVTEYTDLIPDRFHESGRCPNAVDQTDAKNTVNMSNLQQKQHLLRTCNIRCGPAGWPTYLCNSRASVSLSYVTWTPAILWLLSVAIWLKDAD